MKKTNKNLYKALLKNTYKNSIYSIVPIRFIDRIKIMNWRNEQLFHLRQNFPLTIEDQTNYFLKILAPQFQSEKPDQILFSFLRKNKCIGYGGLVHIDWENKNSELSFIMNTKLEEDYFEKYWTYFIKLISKVAFGELKFNKIFVYAFDLRPNLYRILEKNKFIHEAQLKNHKKHLNGFIDVVIYSKFKSDEEN